MYSLNVYNYFSTKQIQQNRLSEKNITINTRFINNDVIAGLFVIAWLSIFNFSLPCSAQWQPQNPTSTAVSLATHSTHQGLDPNSPISQTQRSEKQLAISDTTPTTSTNELEQILSQGTDLETPINGKKTDWNEALNYWENALRDNPTNLQLNRRYYRSRINYDIDRRLADKGYINQVKQMTQADTQLLLFEVLTKIETHYVDSPSWSSLSHNGLVGVQQALRNPTFREQYFANTTNTDLTRHTTKWLTDAIKFNVHSSQDIIDQAMKLGSYVQRDCQVNGAIIIMEYICGLLNTLDPYTGLLTTSQLTDMYNQINGSFVGIGVELKMVKGEIRVIRPIAGSPAQRAGILPGDTILAVNDNWVKDSSPEQISNLLQGTQGTKVKIELARKDVPNQTITIVRQSVKSPSIDNVKIIDTTSKIGYMQIHHFQKSTADELDVALQHLYNNNMRRLVIDLRGNPGGLLQAAIDTSERFLSQGIIVSTKGKDPSENNTYVVQKQQTWNVPLVILINKDSASASELFSGAMRDHHRAKIVGTKSYGKGSVQGIFPLKANSMGLRMTTAKFYSPLGKGYTRVGVSPDLEVHKTALLNEDEDPLIAPAEEDDAVLQAGLNAARELE